VYTLHSKNSLQSTNTLTDSSVQKHFIFHEPQHQQRKIVQIIWQLFRFYRITCPFYNSFSSLIHLKSELGKICCQIHLSENGPAKIWDYHLRISRFINMWDIVWEKNTGVLDSDSSFSLTAGVKDNTLDVKAGGN